MSSLLTVENNSEQRFRSSFNENSFELGGSSGQNHDRLHKPYDTMSASQSQVSDAGGEISTVQRMSSAMLGSLVTSLLGTSPLVEHKGQ